ncbi:MAG: hypothetical protein AAGF77_13320 [Bacteroidota bacterium]
MTYLSNYGYVIFAKADSVASNHTTITFSYRKLQQKSKEVFSPFLVLCNLEIPLTKQ